MLSIEEVLNSASPLLASWDETTNIPQYRAMTQAAKEAAPRIDPVTRPPISKKTFTSPCEATAPLPPASTSLDKTRPRAGRASSSSTGEGMPFGDLDTETWLCALFVRLGGVAVDVDYRLAPGHVFPAAVDDVFDATRWTAQNLESLGIDADKGFLVGGESSGGPPLTGVYAAIPGGVNHKTVPDKYRDRFISLEQNADAPVMSAAAVAFIWSKTVSTEMHMLSSPNPFERWVYADFSRHAFSRGLPKTYFQICGLDPVRDCGLVMEQGWMSYPGLPHAFWGIVSGALGGGGRQRRDAREGFEWLLRR
ncbi:Alpha/Beta hydrolase protein [Trichoderma novae-zelandiae]